MMATFGTLNWKKKEGIEKSTQRQGTLMLSNKIDAFEQALGEIRINPLFLEIGQLHFEWA